MDGIRHLTEYVASSGDARSTELRVPLLTHNQVLTCAIL